MIKSIHKKNNQGGNTNSEKLNILITRIGGGLGNQLFQYAVARNIAILNNLNFRLDLSWFANNNDRKYELSYFNIIENIATDNEIKKLKKHKKKNSRRWFLYNYFLINESKYVEEKQFNFDPNIMKVKSSIYLDGYWQTEKYFKENKELIRKEFTLVNPLSINAKKIYSTIKSKRSVSLHIRRGDYITNKEANRNMGICPIEYYKKAIQIVSQKISNPHFFIFSDDINWAKENLKTHFPITFVSDGKIPDYEELILMKECKHNIIANSSFSWWGAWLNNNTNKTVVAPKKWFNNKARNSSDITPKSWIRM